MAVRSRVLGCLLGGAMAVVLANLLYPRAFAAREEIGKGATDEEKSLGELEKRIRTAAKKALPSVVAVEVGAKSPPLPGVMGKYQAFGSGVLISADGLILSQYHVSHQADARDAKKSHKPGKKLTVILHDGTRCEAELLGASRTHDLSLLKMTKPGPYPFAPLDEKRTVSVGDGAIKLGHPLGYRPGRPPVTRFGRILHVGDAVISDARVAGGDSGGPYFDLEGRLVGIILSSGSTEDAERTRVPRTWMTVAFTPNAIIANQLEAMRKGKILEGKSEPSEPVRTQALSPERWSQGKIAHAALRPATARTEKGVVSLLRGGEQVGLGTVVGDGLILVKASILPAEPTCQLPDGKRVPAEVLGADPAFDLALLKIPVVGLRPVQWREEKTLPVGSLLAAAGVSGRPLGVGVVSVARRDLDGPFATTIPPARRVPAEAPEVIGCAVRGRGYWVEHVAGRLAAAGVQPGDVLVQIGETPIRDHGDLIACVRGYVGGQQVPVKGLRGGKPMEWAVTLQSDREQMNPGRGDGFPTVIEHDIPVEEDELGAPIVDRQGKVVGIAISQAHFVGMAVPADCVRRLLPDLIAGRRKKDWKAPTAPPVPTPKKGAPVDITLEELKKRLTERAGRYKSLSIEYDMTVEPSLEPSQLMSWDVFTIRDYQERVSTAFSGGKLASRVTVTGNRFRLAPPESVKADPLAPADVAKKVESARQIAITRKNSGDTKRWRAIRVGDETRLVYDGTRCFQRNPQTGTVSPFPAENYQHNCLYLWSVGIVPPHPKPSEQQRRAEQRTRLPDALEDSHKGTVSPTEAFVLDTPCVHAEFHFVREEKKGQRETRLEKLWLDPKRDFAPLQWETWIDGRLQTRRTYTDFEEPVPGCWLPNKIVLGEGTPAWVAPRYKNKVAFDYVLQVRKVRVNDVPGTVFDAASLRNPLRK